MGRFSRRRLSRQEREDKKVRRYEKRRQIKGHYQHRDLWHGPFEHPGDKLLQQWFEYLTPDSNVLVSANQRHLLKIEDAGFGVWWHLEQAPRGQDVMLGRVLRKPELAGDLGALRPDLRADGAFVCERLEEQLNLNRYLIALRESVKVDAPVALCVPLAHHEMVDNHVNLFLEGTLLYCMIRAGWNMRDATVRLDPRFVNIIVRRLDIPEPWPFKIDDLKAYLPYPNKYVFQFMTGEMGDTR